MANKSIITKGLSGFLLIASMVYLYRFFSSNREIFDSAFRLSGYLIGGILLLQLIYYLLQSWRFKIIVEKCSDADMDYLEFTRIFVLGRFLNLLFTQAGTVYRSIQLKQRYGITYTRYVTAFSSMAWLDTCLNLVLALLAIACLQPTFKIGNLLAWQVVLVLLVIFLIGPWAFRIIFQHANLRHPKLIWLHERVTEVLNTALENVKDGRFLTKIILLGILLFARTLLVFHLYFLVFNTTVPLVALTMFYTLFKLGLFINLTPGNLGVQEIAWGFLGDQMGISIDKGVLTSAFVRVVGVLVLVVLGLALGGMGLIRDRKQFQGQNNLSQLKE